MNARHVLQYFLLLGLCLMTTLVRADPPARVGRISLVSGQVDFRPDADNNSYPAQLNWPVYSGNILITERFGRAEVRIGSTVLRLESETELEFSQLDDARISLRLLAGGLYLHLRNPEVAKQFEVRNSQGRLTLNGSGQLRLDAGLRPDSTTIKVFSGSARFESQGSNLLVRANQQLTLRYNEIATTELARDDFDEWSLTGDQWNSQSATARYVSQEITGYEELERHGDWRVHEEYGPVWYPRNLAADWAPYRHGSWAWIAPWGWTWVDQAPWGYAPSHYGRWLQVGSRWCWVPGPRTARPVWAPALVGWVTTRRSGEVVASSNIGWFPLSPGDIYQPVYQVSNGYIHSINHGHVHPRVLDGYTGHTGHTGRPGRSGPSGPANPAAPAPQPPANAGNVGNPAGNTQTGFRQGDILYRYQNRGEAVTVMAKDPFGNNRLIQVPSQPGIRRTVIEPRNPHVIPITPAATPASPVTAAAPTQQTTQPAPLATTPPLPLIHNQPQPAPATAPGTGRRSVTEPASPPRNDGNGQVLPAAPATPMPATGNGGSRPLPGEPNPTFGTRPTRQPDAGQGNPPGTRRTVVEPANPHVVPLPAQPVAAQPAQPVPAATHQPHAPGLQPVPPQLTPRPVQTEPERPRPVQPTPFTQPNPRNHAGEAGNPHVVPVRTPPPAIQAPAAPPAATAAPRSAPAVAAPAVPPAAVGPAPVPPRPPVPPKPDDKGDKGDKGDKTDRANPKQRYDAERNDRR